MNRLTHESVALEAAAPFGKGPVFITRRQHTQLKIIVNGREKVGRGQKPFRSTGCSPGF